MARRGTRGLAAAAALVLTLGLVACGGGDGDDTADETTTETADETTTEASEPGDDTSEPADEPGDTEPADEAAPSSTLPESTTTAPGYGTFTEDEAAGIPDAVDLTLDDVLEFDPGFEEQPDDDEDEEDDEIDACFAEIEDLEPLAENEGRTFESSTAVASSATSVMASGEDAAAIVDTFGSEEVRVCFEEYFSQDGLVATFLSYPSGARFGDQWSILTGTLEGAGGIVDVELHTVRTGSIVTLFAYLDLARSGEAGAYVVDGLLTLIDERQAAAVG